MVRKFYPEEFKASAVDLYSSPPGATIRQRTQVASRSVPLSSRLVGVRLLRRDGCGRVYAAIDRDDPPPTWLVEPPVLPGEVWVPVVMADCGVEVSSCGRVRVRGSAEDPDTVQILTTRSGERGVSVQLQVGGRCKTWLVAHLLAKAFPRA